MAAETVIESFCERCGTRYTFEPVRKRESKLIGLGKQLGILLEDHAANLAQRDPFHGTFNFCLECRQYTCPRCWNEAAGFCLGCMPLPEAPDSAALDAAESAADLEATLIHAQASAEHDLLDAPDAWPDADLLRRRQSPELWPAADRAAAASAADLEPDPGPLFDGDPDPAEWSLTFDPTLPPSEVAFPEPDVEAAAETAEERIVWVDAVEVESELVAAEERIVWFDETAEVADDEPVIALGAPEADEAATPAVDTAADADVPLAFLAIAADHVVDEGRTDVEPALEASLPEVEVADLEWIDADDADEVEAEAFAAAADAEQAETPADELQVMAVASEDAMEADEVEAFTAEAETSDDAEVEAAVLMDVEPAETVDAAVAEPELDPADMTAVDADADESDAIADEALEMAGTEEADTEVTTVTEADVAVETIAAAEDGVTTDADEAPEAIALGEAETDGVADAIAVAEPEADAEVLAVAEADEPTVVDEAPAVVMAAAAAAAAEADPDHEADWADLFAHLPAAPDDEPLGDDWSAMAPALGPDIAPSDEPISPPAPAVPTAPMPAPAVSPAVAWQLTPPLSESDAKGTAWPPLGPVFRPAPAPAPTTPHPSVLSPRAANGGVLSRGQSAGMTPTSLPNGVRPCRNCELPLSASARFCRRCGRPQA